MKIWKGKRGNAPQSDSADSVKSGLRSAWNGLLIFHSEDHISAVLSSPNAQQELVWMTSSFDSFFEVAHSMNLYPVDLFNELSCPNADAISRAVWSNLGDKHPLPLSVAKLPGQLRCEFLKRQPHVIKE